MKRTTLLQVLAVQALVFAGAFALGGHGDAEPPNPLIAPWSGAYGGVPPFDRLRPGLFPSALETALAERQHEIERIRSQPRAPTFANTVEALERAGATLDRVGALFSTYSNSLNDEAFAAVEREWAPRLAAARSGMGRTRRSSLGTTCTTRRRSASTATTSTRTSSNPTSRSTT
jgi:peptidyl-dipeptidase Dcp